MIIIDALRYDFTVPFTPTLEDSQPHHYHNGITVLHEIAAERPNNAFLRPFIADPPTTTLVRLKGLTTGTLPTFLDAGSNFAGTAIDEDNIVAQLNTAGRRVVHLGDDTWQALFPDSFDKNLTRAYDSFNVWDLHSVDNGVNEHLIPLLQPGNSSSWDVIFGHYLGVDHAGHRYGPDHPAMAAKLKQMDTVIRNLIRLLAEDTLLVIMGDHGMDGKGDHGGESDDEVQAALWMYAKQPVFGRSAQEFAKPSATAKERPVNQIDLVPTLSLLLGLPIPFNNLGAPIEEAFIGRNGIDFANLATVNRLTAAQIYRYQQGYALVSKPDAASNARLAELYVVATKSWDKYAESWTGVSQAEWTILARSFAAYQEGNLSACKALWARFDLVSIGAGVIVLLAALITSIMLIGALRGSAFVWTWKLTWSGPLILLSLGVAGFAQSRVQETFAIEWPLTPSATFRAYLFFAGILICLRWTYTMLKAARSLLRPKSFWSWLLVVFVLLQSAGFGSNSFTIWEDEILLLFLSTAGILFLAQSLRLQTSAQRRHGIWHSVIFLVSLRLAAMSRLCREEQMPWGRSTYYASATSSTSAPWQLAISWTVALLLPDIIKSYFKLTHSYQGSLPMWLGVAFRICLFWIAVYWTLDAADDGEWFVDISKETLKTVRMYIAQLILFTAAGAGTATFAYMSPCIGLTVVSPPTAPSSTSTSKGLMAKVPEPVPDSQHRPQIVVQGTKNLYGSHFATLPLTVLLIPLLLVQKPMGQGALSLVIIAILSMLEVLHLLSSPPLTTRNGQETTRTSSLSRSATTTALGPVLLALLGHFAYFKTGHQATLASLQWDSAFIPLRTIRYPWSPLLVILNTFAGPILCAAAVPATVLWRRPYNFASDTEDAPDAKGIVLSPPSSPNRTVPNLNGSSKEGNSVQEHRNQQQQLFDRREAERNDLLTDVMRAHIMHIFVYATYSLATTVLAGHLRRHLMLYRIFCPRWMLGSAMLVIAELVGISIGIGGTRWTVGSVGGLFGW